MKRALVIALVVACSDREHDRESAPTPEPQTPQASLPQRARDREDEVCALLARNSADVVARFKSTVTELLVKLNDSVTKGQPVARLDERPLKEELTLARAALRARLAEVATARLERRAAGARLAREQEAFKKDIVAKAILEEAGFNFEKAGTEVNRATAALNEQQARITIVEGHLADTTVVAPEAGRIAHIYRLAGEPTAEGAPIVRVISNDELFVQLATETDRPIKDLEQVELLLDDKIRVKAIVRRVAPDVDPVPQMILAEADLVAPPATLKSGMSCSFRRIKP